MGYKRITLEDREEIFRLRYVEHKLLREIGEQLGKDKSAISRELKRGTKNKLYNPVRGEAARINGRKSQSPHLKMTGELWLLIKPKMEKERWSPEEVEQWLKKEYPEKAMSAKTIYNYIHYHMKGELKKLALADLRQKGKKRRSGSKEAEKRGKITEMTLIDQRPPEIESREIPGHWEGDLIIGKNHKSALLVTVERQKRYVQIDRLLQFDAVTVRKTLQRRFRKLSSQLCKSITFDQGKENSQHKLLEQATGLKVYFCHPHSPWEKGTCENTNFLIRDMLGDITDFREISQQRVNQIAESLNNRPRKTLDYKTPNEVLLELH